MELFMVGYEGFEIEEFTDFLKRKKIQVVADVRKNPVSRKRGFSKHKMAAALKVRNIQYLHLPGLGTPSAWRKLADEKMMTREKMFQDYVEKILPAHPDELKFLRQLLRKKRTALLCYEADASDCHRSFVAQEIQRLESNKLKIVDLK